MYDELFYKRLYQLRIQRGISARDMSLNIGQNAGYINGLENRKGFPSMQVFFYICEYLSVTPAEFFEEDNCHPAALKEIMEALQHLNQEQLHNIKSIILDLEKVNTFCR